MSLSDEVLEWVDGARGDVPRSRFVDGLLREAGGVDREAVVVNAAGGPRRVMDSSPGDVVRTDGLPVIVERPAGCPECGALRGMHQKGCKRSR